MCVLVRAPTHARARVNFGCFFVFVFFFLGCEWFLLCSRRAYRCVLRVLYLSRVRA